MLVTTEPCGARIAAIRRASASSVDNPVDLTSSARHSAAPCASNIDSRSGSWSKAVNRSWGCAESRSNRADNRDLVTRVASRRSACSRSKNICEAT